MTFLNFSQFPKNIFRPNLKENTFLEIKLNSFDWKVFFINQFYNNKQTQKYLKNNFLNYFLKNKHILIENTAGSRGHAFSL